MDLIWVGLVGLLFGSFATVMCYRIPREIPLGLVSHQRSRCPHCDKMIPGYRNIPLVSYLLQKGRCAECQKKISPVYPLIEFLTAAFFVLTYWACQRSPEMPLESMARWAEIVKALYFTLSLIVVVFIDLEFRIIPDRFSLGNWVVALLAAFLWGVPSWQMSLAGGLFGFGIFWLIATIYEKRTGVEGLGFGDVKMMGWLGSWVGFLGVPFVILTASLTGAMVGLIVMRRSNDGLKTAIPFGPFLALAAYVAWILQQLGLANFLLPVQ